MTEEQPKITLDQLIGLNMFTDMVFHGKRVRWEALADDMPVDLIDAWKAHVEAAVATRVAREKLVEVAKKYGIEPSPLS